jgi:hypothetical protein
MARLITSSKVPFTKRGFSFFFDFLAFFAFAILKGIVLIYGFLE